GRSECHQQGGPGRQGGDRGGHYHRSGLDDHGGAVLDLWPPRRGHHPEVLTMELRYTDTNAADDSEGRVYGLDGNLYLPILFSSLGALVILTIFGLIFRLSWGVSAAIVAIPLGGVFAWV